MRRQKQQIAVQHQQSKRIVNTSPSPPTDSSVLSTSQVVVDMTPTSTNNVISATRSTSLAFQDKLLWAKVMASKAHAETANVAKHMGKIDELEKGMALFFFV